MPDLPLTCQFPSKGLACPCRRLLDPWNTDVPPEIFCVETARATVRRWAETWWHDWLHPLLATEGNDIPASMHTVAATRPDLADLLAKLDQHRVAAGLLDRWPLPLETGGLALILRQWVQEPPNPTLGNQMSANPIWSRTVAKFRDRHDRSTQLSGQAKQWTPRLLGDVVELLAQCQIPATPATVGFTLATVAGVSNVAALPPTWERLILHDRNGRPLPARGVLITTRVFAALVLPEADDFATPQKPRWLLQANAELRLSGDLAHVTGPFIEDQLASALLAHREFAKRVAQHPFTATSAIRQAQPGSFAHREIQEGVHLDYVEEARRTAREELHDLRSLPEWRLTARIDQILTRVADTVRHRRQRAGVATAPPKGWRHDARRLIREELGL